MRIVLVAMMVALLAVPAYARGKKDSGAQQQNSEQKTKARAQEEKDYKSALSPHSQSEARRSVGQGALSALAVSRPCDVLAAAVRHLRQRAPAPAG